MKRECIALAVAACATASRAQANPLDTFGLGSREASMAGAMVADTQGFAANYYNPAGLVFAPGTELALGYLYAWQKLRTNGRDNGVDPVRGTVAIPARGRHEPLVS